MTRRDALLKLLRDDDPTTLQLVKNQLAEPGAAALPELRTLLEAADPRAAQQLREVVAAIEEREADTIFGQLCAEFEEEGDLEEAVWRLAAAFTPCENVAAAREMIDAWGAEVAFRCRKAETALDRIETLVEFLSDEIKLRGNEQDFYRIENSILPEVIESRRGIPITLSLIYMMVGRRAGIPMQGVGLPGHFIVRSGADFFDPFYRGRRVGLAECRALLETQGVALTAQHLQPVTPRQMLLRMLANIHSLADAGDPPLAAKVAGWMERLRKG